MRSEKHGSSQPAAIRLPAHRNTPMRADEGTAPLDFDNGWNNCLEAIEKLNGQPAASAEPVKTETITDGIRLPVDQMAGAAWNILDATGARVMIAGSLDGGKWTYRPALAAQVVKLLNDSVAAPVAQEPVAVIGADFGLFWIGSGPIAPIIKRHGLKVGSKLYAAPVAAQAQPSAQDREDAERMDWLDGVAHCADWLDGEPTKRVIRASDGAEFTGDTWREAIDAARAAKGADHG